MGQHEGGVLNHTTVTSMLTAVTDGDAATGSAEAENAEAADDEQTMLNDTYKGTQLTPDYLVQIIQQNLSCGMAFTTRVMH